MVVGRPGQRTVGPLAAGGTSGPVDTPVTIPPTATVGTYYLIARADADAVQAETSEINNTRSTTVMIGVDLIVSALTGAEPRPSPRLLSALLIPFVAVARRYRLLRPLIVVPIQ